MLYTDLISSLRYNGNDAQTETAYSIINLIFFYIAISFQSLPHPWLITEDAHTNIPGVLGYFSKFTQPGDYLVAEDTHPAINKHHSYGSGYEPVGPTKILNPYKEFMKKHGSQYRVDTGYTDMYG